MSSERPIFICHSSRDADLARAICLYLEKYGIRCWVSFRDIPPGRHYPQAIIEAIKRCYGMLVVLSKAANESKDVANEVERAFHHKLFILPFRIEKFELSESLEYFLGAAQALNAVTGKPEDHFGRLLTQCLVLRAGKRPMLMKKVVAQRSKRSKPVVVLLLLVGLVGCAVFYFSDGHNAQRPNGSLPAQDTQMQLGQHTFDKATDSMHVAVQKSEVSEAPRTSPLLQRLDSADFIDGPAPGYQKSDYKISFSGADGNEIGFFWHQENYEISGKMMLKGDVLEVVAGDATGSLYLSENGTKIKGSLTVTRSGATYEIDFTRAR